jgi:hypothetical protein
MPVTAGRQELVEWLTANAPRFPDWDTATSELAQMISARESPEFSAYVARCLRRSTARSVKG